jgi:hypothetical protein
LYYPLGDDYVRCSDSESLGQTRPELVLNGGSAMNYYSCDYFECWNYFGACFEGLREQKKMGLENQQNSVGFDKSNYSSCISLDLPGEMHIVEVEVLMEVDCE